MTAPRPDIDALDPEHLLAQMRKYLRLTETAEASYLERDAEILAETRASRRIRSEGEARVTAKIRSLTDPGLRERAQTVAFYGSMVAVYSSALQGEAAYRSLTDRPVPPAGRNPGPRLVPPAAPGARPGTGPDITPGMTVSYELRHGPGAPGTVAGTVIAVRADGTAQVRFRQDGGVPMEVIAPLAAFSPVQTASGGGDPRA